MNQQMVSVSISQLRANPFREMEDFPLDRDKIDKLKESITSTGFWGTIVARKKGSAYEIAFGHHRKAALEELQTEGVIGKTDKVDIIARDLTNEQMIQLMARENLEEWGTNAYIEAQTVESTIRAYGRGEIELPEPTEKTKQSALRYDPPGSADHPYTMASVAAFLGWTKSGGEPNHACKVAFEMLDAFEIGIVSRKELRGVKRDVAREIVAKAMSLHREQERIASERRKMAQEAEKRAADELDAKKARSLLKAADEFERQAEVAESSAKSIAKEFAKDAVKQTKTGNWSQRDVREAGDKAKSELRSNREQQHKTARQLYDGLTREVSEMLNEAQDERFESLRLLLTMDCGLQLSDIKKLRDEVNALQSRAATFAKELGAWKPKDTDTSDNPRLLKIVG